MLTLYLYYSSEPHKNKIKKAYKCLERFCCISFIYELYKLIIRTHDIIQSIIYL